MYMCVSGSINVCFSENLMCLVFLLPPFWDSPFCLITDNLWTNVKKIFSITITLWKRRSLAHFNECAVIKCEKPTAFIMTSIINRKKTSNDSPTILWASVYSLLPSLEVFTLFDCTNTVSFNYLWLKTKRSMGTKIWSWTLAQGDCFDMQVFSISALLL